MAGPGALKRQKEILRKERATAKDVDREQRKQQKAQRPRGEGEDPDLAGIIAGPQPLPTED